MTTKLVSGLNEALGCCFLPGKNQLLFVERGKEPLERGKISLLDFVNLVNPIEPQKDVVLKGGGYLNLDPGKVVPPIKSNSDLHWVLIDNVKRQMEPISGASIVNLGKVQFSSLTLDDLQNLVYGSTPIPGNNDSTNQLVNDDVFAVRTKTGNLAKIRVVSYGEDMSVEWTTYAPPARYHVLTGLVDTSLNDIAVSSDGKTAYATTTTKIPVNSQTSLVKINLDDRSIETVYSIKDLPGLPSFSQIYLDEPRQQVYVVEFPGRLLRIDLNSGQMTVVLDGLYLPRGVLISADLNYAYISGKQGIRRYSLQGGDVVDIATGLNNPGYLTWADNAQSAMFVTEDPNCVTIVDTKPTIVNNIPVPGSGRKVIKDVVRPMSTAVIDATHLLVCCANEIYMCDPTENIPAPAGLFKGIGRVLSTFINTEGKADTSTSPDYPYRFDNVPFGGYLSLNINHPQARVKGYAYYRVKVDDKIRYDTWSDMQLNPATGKYDIEVRFTPMVLLDSNGKVLLDDTDGTPLSGFYPVHKTDVFGNADLAMILDSSSLPTKKQTLKIEFRDINGSNASVYIESQDILIDNNPCFAKIEMPQVDGVSASQDCGMLKYANNQKITMVYYASHPNLFATYSWRVGRAGKGTVQADGCSVDGDVSLRQFNFGPNDVENLLGSCTAAAFYAYVYVYAKATNGESRQSQYDAFYAIAFALAP